MFAAIWQFISYEGFSNDHYMHVARAYQMLRGEWPVRDFVDPGMPLMYVASAAGRLLFGEAVRSEFIVVAAGFAVGAAAALVAASRLAGSTAAGCAVAWLIVLIAPRSYSYPKVLLYGLAGYAITVLAARPSRRRVLAAAGLTVFAFLFRHDHGLYIGAACAVAVLLASPVEHDTRVKSLGLFAGAVALFLAPWAIFVQLNGGLAPYFESSLEFSRREADVTVLRIIPAFDWTKPWMTVDNSVAWLFLLFIAMPVLCLLLVWWRHTSGHQRWRGEGAAVAALSVLALVVDAGFLRDPIEARVADAVVPAALLGAWLVGVAWSAAPWRFMTAGIARTCALALLFATAAAVMQVGEVYEKVDEFGFTNDRDAVEERIGEVTSELNSREIDMMSKPTRVSAALTPFLRYVERCTAPADRLLVTGQFPEMYVMARRRFAGGHVAFIENYYSSEAEQQLTLKRLRAESVPFVVLSLEAQENVERSFPMLLMHFEQSYDLLSDLPVPDIKAMRVLVARDRRPTHTDAETGWPCFT